MHSARVATGKKIIFANICIGQEIRCLPYAGFFIVRITFTTKYFSLNWPTGTIQSKNSNVRVSVCMSVYL